MYSSDTNLGRIRHVTEGPFRSSLLASCLGISGLASRERRETNRQVVHARVQGGIAGSSGRSKAIFLVCPSARAHVVLQLSLRLRPRARTPIRRTFDGRLDCDQESLCG